MNKGIKLIIHLKDGTIKKYDNIKRYEFGIISGTPIYITKLNSYEKEVAVEDVRDVMEICSENTNRKEFHLSIIDADNNYLKEYTYRTR